MKMEIKKDAVDAIKAIMEEEQNQPGFVRVFVAGFSCSGASFGLALDEKKAGDVVDDSNEVVFIMEEDLYNRFGEISIEYIDGGFLVKPLIEEPSACGSCSGCCGH